MSLYKPTKSRFWHYDFVFQGRRYHGSTGGSSKRDAAQFEAEVRRKAALGETAKPSITVDEAGGLWWDAVGQHLRSHATVIYQLENLAVGLGKNVPLRDVSLTMLDKYIARRRTQVKNASVNRETGLLRQVVNFCEARGYDTPKIAWGQVKLKEAAPQTRVLSHEEQDRLFNKLPDGLKPIVEFAILSGQRKSEIVTLRWADVDLNKMRAIVWAKGQKPHSFPLTPRLGALIANQPKVCAQVFTYVAERSAPRRKDRVQRIKGERYPFSAQGWDRKWRKALKDAEIEDYRFHDNRHTALSRTGKIETAFVLAGHSDIRTTKRYFHTAERDVREAMIAAEFRIIPEPQPESAKNARKAAND